MKNKNTHFLDIAIPATFKILCFAVALTLIWSWIGNILRVLKCDFEPPYKAEVIRIIGVFIPPVGVIAYWVDIGTKGE